MIRSGSPTAGFFLFEVACLNALKISRLGFYDIGVSENYLVKL